MATLVTRGGKGGESIAEFNPAVFALEVPSVEINLIHELGREGTGRVQERFEVIEPSTTPTAIRIRFQVVGGSSKVLGSPVYMATLRRRKVGNIAKSVSELEQYSEREDFMAYTFEIIEKLKSLVTELQPADNEGRTREILRQVRNSFLDGGWESYRRAAARQTVTTILDRLAATEDVESDEVQKVFQELTKNKLNAVGPCLPAFDEEEEGIEQDGEEEREIPR